MKALAIMAGAGLLTLATQANATIYLSLQAQGVNNGQITQIGSDGGTGSLGYTGYSYGQFTNNITAQGSPTLPQPSFQTTAVDTRASSAGMLTIYITQTDLKSFSGTLKSSFIANTIFNFGAGAASVAESTYYNLANLDVTDAGYVGTLLNQDSFSDQGNSNYVQKVDLKGPFSETAKYVINIGAGGGSVNDAINITAAPGAVPEPASWAMMLAGFGFIGASLRQRRRAAVSFG